ncbi:MAG: hypothetical protein KGK11_03845 [Sphingomonadales bacterium]|nr:hypothetical protein [Sphingomonadales bacterium]
MKAFQGPFAIIAAAVAPAVPGGQQVPAPPPIQTQLREGIAITSDWLATPDDSDERPPQLVLRAGDRPPASEIPRDLAVGSSVTARLRVDVGTDDKPGNCQPVAVRLERPGASERDGDSRYGALACALVAKYARFRHGLDNRGKAESASAGVAIRFYRIVAPTGPIPVVVAPPPVPFISDYGRLENRPTAWPPPAAATGISFSPPPFALFRPAHVQPGESKVGLTLTLERSAVINCRIGLASGDPDLDKASCAAVQSARTSVSWEWSIELAVLVVWKGRNARLVLPKAVATPPGFASPIAFSGRADPQDSKVTLMLRTNDRSRISHCRIVRSSGVDALDARACELASNRIAVTPGSDIFGQPLDGSMMATVDFGTRLIRAGWR